MYVGIDTGSKGAIASIENGELKCFPMPESSEIDTFFKQHKKQIEHVFLEKAFCMSGQGVRSIFSYAEHYGIIQGILIANEIPHTLIPPQGWQKMLFFKRSKGEDSKKRALEAANRVFAKKASFWLASSRCRKPHDGMIDASLIAEACRRTFSLAGVLKGKE